MTLNLTPTKNVLKPVFFFSFSFCRPSPWYSRINQFPTVPPQYIICKEIIFHSHLDSELTFVSNDLGRKNKRCFCFLQRHEAVNMKEFAVGNHKLLQHGSPLPSRFCHSHFVSEVLRYGTAVLRCTDAFIRNTC